MLKAVLNKKHHRRPRGVEASSKLLLINISRAVNTQLRFLGGSQVLEVLVQSQSKIHVLPYLTDTSHIQLLK